MKEHKENLSIYMIIQKYPPEIGGAEAQADRLSKALVSLGHNIRVLTIEWNKKELLINENRNGVSLLRVGGKIPKKLKTAFFAIYILLDLINKRNSYDIVHIHLLSSHAISATLISAILNKPSVVKFGASGIYGDVGANKNNLWGNLKLLWVRYVSDAIIVLNQAMLDEIKNIKIPLSKIHLKHNGVDTSVFKPANSELKANLRIKYKLPSGVLVVFTGFFKHQKGIDILLNAWKLFSIKNNNANLIIIGTGPLEEDLKQLAHKNNIQETIIWMGQQNNIYEILQASDIFILPSRAEGISNSLLEAMACELPPIVTDIPGNNDVVVNHNIGCLTPQNNPQAMAIKIEELVLDEKKRIFIGKNARAHVEENYSIISVAKSYITLYNKIIS